MTIDDVILPLLTLPMIWLAWGVADVAGAVVGTIWESVFPGRNSR